jgi:hypothetical protein
MLRGKRCAADVKMTPKSGGVKDGNRRDFDLGKLNADAGGINHAGGWSGRGESRRNFLRIIAKTFKAIRRPQQVRFSTVPRADGGRNAFEVRD